MIVATFIFGFLKYTKREIDLRQLIWVGYLFMISVVEEIAFRLSLPLLITSDPGFSFGLEHWAYAGNSMPVFLLF